MGVQVNIQDVRASQLCSRGTREFCNSLGLSWDTFLREGYDSDYLRTFDNAILNKVIEAAEARHAR